MPAKSLAHGLTNRLNHPVKERSLRHVRSRSLPRRNPRLAGSELPARNARAGQRRRRRLLGRPQLRVQERCAEASGSRPASPRATPCPTGRRPMAARACPRPRPRCCARKWRAIGARPPLSSFGIWMLGPALLKFGTEEQKVHYLNQIARGEIRWCQGYSEPGIGLRPRLAADLRRGQGRPLGGQRPEDLDQLCRQGRLDLLPRPHRQDEQVPGHQLPAVRHGDARRHAPSRSC